MYKVFIVDDEEMVRQGLKLIIDWTNLGFEICGEAADGETAYQRILKMKPDLLLADIRMPKLQGLDLVSKLREANYLGKIILVSGYADFKYAQQAITYNVDYYLTKPVDEDELKAAVESIRETLDNEIETTQYQQYHQDKARIKILEELLLNSYDIDRATNTWYLNDFSADNYRVVLLGSYQKSNDVYKSFCKEFIVLQKNKELDHLRLNQQDVLILKGDLIINRLDMFISSNKMPEKRNYFLALGSVIQDIHDLSKSYQDALMAFNYRFFSSDTPLAFEYNQKPLSIIENESITFEDSHKMGKAFYETVIIKNQMNCTTYLELLIPWFYKEYRDISQIKTFLSSLYQSVIREFQKDYPQLSMSFSTNDSIFEFFQNQDCIYDIMDYMCREMTPLLNQVTNQSSDQIIETIINYVNAHSHEDLLLKDIARKYGYNCSYLGKVFSQRLGMAFNEYLHQIRIEKAKSILVTSSTKIYEISEMVGYKKVDYFHIKFKEIVGCTPMEFREKNETQNHD